MSKICLIHGHPDSRSPHFCRALGDAYRSGADAAGHEVSEIILGDLEFDFLRSPTAFEADPAEPILSEREKIAAADHLVVVFPLWLGGAPALLKAFLEQCAAGGFFLQDAEGPNAFPKSRMKGKSARLVLTMGMPGLIYKFWFGAHSVKGLEKGIFELAGFKPVHHTIYGSVEEDNAPRHEKWLDEMRELGRQAK